MTDTMPDTVTDTVSVTGTMTGTVEHTGTTTVEVFSVGRLREVLDSLSDDTELNLGVWTTTTSTPCSAPCRSLRRGC
jgi:hypothetical protein